MQRLAKKKKLKKWPPKVAAIFDTFWFCCKKKKIEVHVFIKGELNRAHRKKKNRNDHANIKNIQCTESQRGIDTDRHTC